MVVKTNNKVHVFERTRSEILVGRYSNKFLLIVWSIFTVYESFNGLNFSYPRAALTVLLPIIGGICIISTLLFWKFAYKIIFDFEDMKVTFFMFKKKKPIQIKISEIRQVLFSLYVIIYHNNKSIYFQGYDDLEFIKFLEKNAFPIKWGKAGKFSTKKKS